MDKRFVLQTFAILSCPVSNFLLRSQALTMIKSPLSEGENNHKKFMNDHLVRSLVAQLHDKRHYLVEGNLEEDCVKFSVGYWKRKIELNTTFSAVPDK